VQHEFDIDNWRVQVRLFTILPNASNRTRNAIISRLYSEKFPPHKSQAEFNKAVDLRLESLCREHRDGTLSPIERRRRNARDGGAPLTRAEMLKATAAAALDFNAEMSRCDESGRPDSHGDIVLLNITHLNRGQFVFMRVNYSFLPDLKRVWKQLRLKGGRLYVSTTKDIDHFGKKTLYLCPLISVVAARKYETPQFNATLLTARVINGNPLDLSFENIVIPALEPSGNTKRLNAEFNKKVLTLGHSDGRLAHPMSEMDAKPRRPQGAGPDDSEGYMSWFLAKWASATDLSPELAEKEADIGFGEGPALDGDD
jgi:hypothetical protein